MSAQRVLQVLIVEPDYPLALQYQLELMAAGHNSNIVSNGEDALAVASLRYDLVLTDLNLPGMSGVDFIYQLRSRTGFADMPFLVIAAYGELPGAIANGQTTLKRKPFNWDHFIQFVTEAAGPKRFRH